jgi:serine phosphatase RsbU (regulator of sigma subunit)
MLELKDFYHLPQLEPLVEQIAAEAHGLVVVAGLDPRPLLPSLSPDGFLPSGRSALFRILMRHMLLAHPGARAVVVAEGQDAVRIPRPLRRRVQLLRVQPPDRQADVVAHAADLRPDLLVIDRLDADAARAALEAAQSGLWVLSQLDTVFRGAAVAHHLLDLGVPRGLLGGLAWVVAVQRLATLCPRCKEPAPLNPAQLAELRRRFPDLDAPENAAFYQARGCPGCHHTGRAGEVTAFDIFRAAGGVAGPLDQPSLLPLEVYLLGLALQALLPLEDVLHLETDQLRRAYHLLAASEQALAQANTALERKVAELESANHVLQHRTEALISLEGIGQALITSTGLDELAAQLCRHARDLCGADRVVLYLLHPEAGSAEVLSVYGWDPSSVHQPVEAALVSGPGASPQPLPGDLWPPGIPRHLTDVTASALRAGLRVPFIAQDRRVGLMIVHTAKPRFTPGEVALLQTFANQAALAIQRAQLVAALQLKIEQLEAAQAGLVKKERMERELELARQVQQSMLPRIFPLLPGYTFAASNRPARQVGGDFYDVILLDADRFGLAIGDVSDKGMPAALYMALTRSLLLAEARREASPQAVLSRVHHLLQDLGQPGLFVTVFYGVVDGPMRRLRYARAGHDRPLLLRSGKVQPLGGEGTFLGFPDLEDLHLSEQQIDLHPGDRLVLYTDGLIDALAPDGRAFGQERLLGLLQANAGLPPADLCTAVFSGLNAYQGTAAQYDDMTLLVVEVK